MLKVGLTGNIGSGKSLVAEMFSIFGVPVYHADQESKKFLGDPLVKEKILSLFGEIVLTPTGEIDRRALATIVFSDEKALMTLDSILHPMVIDDFMHWCETFGEYPYIIQEAAIIFESGVTGIFDRIIHVSCPKEIAIKRVMKRDGIDANSVLQRMRYQMEDAEKAGRSDFVIRNDGTEMIIPQVLSINKQLSEIGAQHKD
ncbi:MAG: dephospho-CoA kinase [Bacteroidales bacterium]|jgi:dephospho-CoA kinase